MGAEILGHGLIGSCTHDGGDVGVVKDVNHGAQYMKLIIKGQGKIGPSVKRIVGFDRTVTLTMVGGVSPIPAGTKGTLIVHLIESDGVSIDTLTWTDMRAFEDSGAAQDGNGQHDSITQVFEYEGDGDSDNFSFVSGN